MFIGHFAVGFGSKKFAPRTNMAILIAAPGIVAEAILIPWAWWFDAHRALRAHPASYTSL
jgi:hypothetical protein